MTHASLKRCLLIPLLTMVAILVSRDCVRAQSDNEGLDLSIELVDPKVLRVCADPRNLPFSNEKGEGFENKLAELFAAKLQKKIDYMYFPQATGFVRMTLGAHRCDVIMGFPQGDDLVQGTNPYYRTAYALVSKQNSGLDDVTTLEDARLKGKHIGIVAGTPPATNMAVNGLMTNAKPYPLMIDTRVDSSAEAMINDLNKGEIDAAILWGPMAGFYAKKANPPLHVTPLVNEKTGPQLVYRIGMGVRRADQNWKRLLNRLIQENQPEINKILFDYGVPLLDENNQPISRGDGDEVAMIRYAASVSACADGARRRRTRRRTRARARGVSHRRLSSAGSRYAGRCARSFDRGSGGDLARQDRRVSSTCCRARQNRQIFQPVLSGATSPASIFPAASGCRIPVTASWRHRRKIICGKGCLRASGGDRAAPDRRLLPGRLLDVVECRQANAVVWIFERRLVSGRHRRLAAGQSADRGGAA